MARMPRRTKRKIWLIAALVTLLSLLAILYVNYRATHKLGFNVSIESADSVPAPQFLYSFAGKGQQMLNRPLGVLADGDTVWVTDSVRGLLVKFRMDGTYVASYGQGKLITPLYVAKNPRNGNLYVTDRRLRAIQIFDPNGKFVGEFNPNLPANQRPKLATKDQWAPVALAFAPNGSLYVTEILNGHRLLVFDADGKFKKSVGTAGMVTDANKGPEFFQFPNSIKVHGSEVFVSDSNNRRIQVFNLEGKYLRIIATSGLPRGFDFLTPLPGVKKDAPAMFAVVDTLAHDATIWNVKGKNIVNFGTQGVLDGQFSYPNDLSVGAKDRLFVADTNNGRIQVWGWPEEVAPIALPKIPQQWGWCLTPLLLLPLLLLLRKKRFAVTPDFVDGLITAELAHTMPAPRRLWMVTERGFDLLKDRSQGEVHMAELLEATEYSDSDARALMERFEIDAEQAATLAVAQRAKVFCTEDPELRRLGKMLDIDVCDRQAFLDRFAKGAGAAQNDKTA
jgi:sugar lactone lactonase YvrE